MTSYTQANFDQQEYLSQFVTEMFDFSSTILPEAFLITLMVYWYLLMAPHLHDPATV